MICHKSKIFIQLLILGLAVCLILYLHQKHTQLVITVPEDVVPVPRTVIAKSVNDETSSNHIHLEMTSMYASINQSSQRAQLDRKRQSHCNEPIRVVFLPGNWIDAADNDYQTQECDIPCLYTKDTRESALNITDAVVIHLPTHSKPPDQILKKYKVDSNKVLKVGISMESTQAHPHQFDYLSDYDIEMTYRMSSDVPDPYFTFARGKQNLLEKTNSTWEEREKAVLFIARNCKSISNREKLVKMLQKYVRVDSVSDCLHNKDWPIDIPRTDKRTLLRRYMALLAAENSIEKDYVTEKVYAGLITGAVPVYYGAPNVDEFVPTNSIIKVPSPLSEEGVREVAERIKQVFSSKEEYERLTYFKQLGRYEDRFLERFNFTKLDVKCRLCQKIYQLKCT